MKTCSTCGQLLPESAFPKNGRGPGGIQLYRSDCNDCRTATKREYHATNRVVENLKRKARYYRNVFYVKWRAIYGTRRDRPGDITVEDLRTVWTESSKKCHYCNTALNEKKPKTWTFDHAEPLARGGIHDPENLRVACVPCNRKKERKKDGIRILIRNHGRSVLRVTNET